MVWLNNRGKNIVTDTPESAVKLIVNYATHHDMSKKGKFYDPYGVLPC